VMSPNEGRAKFDLKPVEGGAQPYLQQQNYSLEALAKRDAQADPFAPATPPAPKPVPADAAPPAETPPAQKSVPLEDMGGIFDRALFAHREAA
jgi:phage portal protein BeeE